MINLQLKLSESRMLLGGPMYVEVHLINQSTDPIDLPEPGVASPDLKFGIFKPGITDPVAVLSEQGAQFQTDPDMPFMPLPSGILVEPKATVVYKFPLGEWLTSPVSPGNYTISVYLQHDGNDYVSDPVAVTLYLPAVQQLSVLPSLHGRNLHAFFSAAPAAGPQDFFDKLCKCSNPGQSVFYRRTSVETETPPGSLSIALDAGDEGQMPPPKWFAMLVDGTIAGYQSAFRSVLSAPAAIPLDLKEARLISQGIQYSGDLARFFVLGRGGSGSWEVHGFEFTGKQIRSIWSCPLDFVPLGPIRTVVSGNGETAMLLFNSHTANGSAIRRIVVNTATGSPVSSAVLFQTEDLIADFTTSQSAAGADLPLHLLLKLTTSPEPSWRYLTVNGQDIAAQWDFVAPGLPEPDPDAEFWLAQPVSKSPLLLARTRSKFFILRPNLSSDWLPFNNPDVTNIHLVPRNALVCFPQTINQPEEFWLTGIHRRMGLISLPLDM
jgi:hypothetical protein